MPSNWNDAFLIMNFEVPKKLIILATVEFDYLWTDWLFQVWVGTRRFSAYLNCAPSYRRVSQQNQRLLCLRVSESILALKTESISSCYQKLWWKLQLQVYFIILRSHFSRAYNCNFIRTLKRVRDASQRSASKRLACCGVLCANVRRSSSGSAAYVLCELYGWSRSKQFWINAKEADPPV
jgi:hypothetical protein